MDKLDVVVVGAGAAGCACALTLARGGASVLLLEKQKAFGRKVLLSGNGRCNITNTFVSADKYYADREFISHFLPAFGFKECADFLASLGVLIEVEEAGRCFCAGGGAAGVRDAFGLALGEAGARLELEQTVCAIEKKGNFELTLSGGRVLTAENLALACGSAAYTAAGADEKSYALAKSLGHSITSLAPAMSALELDGKFLKHLHGVRVKAGVSVGAESSAGEIIFSGNTISGLPVLSLSRIAEAGGEIIVNFFPYFSATEFKKFLEERIALMPERKLENFFKGLLPDGAAAALLEYAGVSKNVLAGKMAGGTFSKLACALQSARFAITAVKGLEKAMSCKGGVNTKEIGPGFASQKCEKLFIIGEMADIDARCGGYSLHYAIASGVLSAKHILRNTHG